MDEKGEYLGIFDADDAILVLYKDGNYEVTDQELTQKIDSNKVIAIEKFNPDKIITAIYVDMKSKQFMAKRFKIETPRKVSHLSKKAMVTM
jgi:topoisomerase-4 subunit A